MARIRIHYSVRSPATLYLDILTATATISFSGSSGDIMEAVTSHFNSQQITYSTYSRIHKALRFYH